MNIQYPTRNIQSRRKEIKPEAVDFRVSDLSGVVRRLPDEDGCYRVANSVSGGAGFEKTRQARCRAGQGLICPAEGGIKMRATSFG